MALNAFEITPSLWQGSYPTREDVEAQGFTHLILCAQELQLWHNNSNVQVIHAPNTDNGQPLTETQLKIAIGAARQAAQAIDNKGKVLVTCAGGRNRSGLVSALTLYIVLTVIDGNSCANIVRCKYTLAPPGALSAVPSFQNVLDKLPIALERGQRLAHLERLSCS